MVSVTHSIAQAGAEEAQFDLFAEGLPPEARGQLAQAADYAKSLYGENILGTGEPAWQHALGMALVAASLRLDLDTRLAALLFAASDYLEDASVKLAERFGTPVAELVDGLRRLKGLQLVTARNERTQSVKAQAEVLRKMLLAMSEDIRVVLLRLASRTQTLRHLAEHPEAERADVARESLDIYAPLANRIGVWHLKWELEDLAFRFLEPDTYKRIAKMLDERRVEREQFIEEAIARLQGELAEAGVQAEVAGRPKHLYSIYSKMKSKNIGFAEVYDVRALRVLVGEVKDCYTVLGIVHHLWQPIPKEFDDYIAHPKGNDYRSLHTAVIGPGGRALEVQVRTHEMHQHAELGVAAHWRYKEKTGSDARYDDTIAWLRQLLSWRDEISDSSEWVRQFKRAALDDTLYVLTPQGRVIDLARGATPVDFAYRLHTDLGHRCRGAKVNGALVPLNTPLENGQTVEIVTVKQGGPSRDWLSGGYLASPRALAKVRQWFRHEDFEVDAAAGRSALEKELSRLGATSVAHDKIAASCGFARTEEFFAALGRGEVTGRQIEIAVRGEAPAAPPPAVTVVPAPASRTSSGVLVLGVNNIATLVAKCCKPVPPDAIVGFVTRTRGVMVHRADCPNITGLAGEQRERLLPADWGKTGEAPFSADVEVVALDRQGLLRDISEAISRERINVTAVNTLSRGAHAFMRFTLQVDSADAIQRVLRQVRDVPGVDQARRL